ncbi:alpha-2C adrenergic receptor-like [Branchiostoma floridae]|uniref:Alpha-2C adrenergic receptor-like n=1 Tax=Branchiostoma floridae TaxID=7739 RepID=A0A9J7KRG5_BRAFL|nr:alpha-2C adrenergic receptor-like [Branchiostoma floridae]
MATTGEYIIVVINGINTVVTIVGGLLTILTICTRPALRKLVNAPLVSLSCADILFAILFSPFWIHQILNPLWEPPPALCWVLAYSTPVLLGVSLCHMLCIALQCYFKICTHSTRLNSSRTLVIMLFITWLAPMVSFLPLHIIEEVKVDPKLKKCSVGNSDKIWALMPPLILNTILPYIATLAFYILIQNHVRKSKKRVQANAQGPSARLAVKCTQGEGGGAGPSTSTETGRVAKPVRNRNSLVWAGEEMSTSSDGEQKASDQIKPSKPKDAMILVAPAPGTELNEQGKTSLSSDEEQKGNDLTEPDKAQDMTPTVATVSQQTGKTGRQQHAVPGSSSQNSSSAAERQITKMMMMLFAVYTLCFIPITIMGIFSSQVPAEAFNVGQLLLALNGSLNPIVYGVMNKNIRQGYKHVLTRSSTS